MKSSTTANRLIEQAVLTNFFPDMENESLLLNDFELAFLQFGWTYGAVFLAPALILGLHSINVFEVCRHFHPHPQRAQKPQGPGETLSDCPNKLSSS